MAFTMFHQCQMFGCSYDVTFLNITKLNLILINNSNSKPICKSRVHLPYNLRTTMLVIDTCI